MSRRCSALLARYMGSLPEGGLGNIVGSTRTRDEYVMDGRYVVERILVA